MGNRKPGGQPLQVGETCRSGKHLIRGELDLVTIKSRVGERKTCRECDKRRQREHALSQSLVERGVCRGKLRHPIRSDADTIVFKRSDSRTYTVCRACYERSPRLIAGDGKTGIFLDCSHVVVFRTPWPQLGEMLYCSDCEEWRLAKRYTDIPGRFRA